MSRPSTSSAGRSRPSSRSRWSTSRCCGSSTTRCRRSARSSTIRPAPVRSPPRRPTRSAIRPRPVPVPQAVVEERRAPGRPGGRCLERRGGILRSLARNVAAAPLGGGAAGAAKPAIAKALLQLRLRRWRWVGRMAGKRPMRTGYRNLSDKAVAREAEETKSEGGAGGGRQRRRGRTAVRQGGRRQRRPLWRGCLQHPGSGSRPKLG